MFVCCQFRQDCTEEYFKETNRMEFCIVADSIMILDYIGELFDVVSQHKKVINTTRKLHQDKMAHTQCRENLITNDLNFSKICLKNYKYFLLDKMPSNVESSSPQSLSSKY